MAGIALSKRVLVNKANSNIVLVAAAASFVVIFSLVASKTLISQMNYQNHVISAKKTALKQLKSDIQATGPLVTSYKIFDGTLQNIIGGTSTGTAANDGTNSTLILDALPSKYDFPALATSIEKLISARGLQIQDIQGTDDEVAQSANQSSTTPKPVPMPFQLTVLGNYTALQGLIADFQNSIRPFQIQSVDLSGAESNMTLTLTAQTFYQPEKDLNITTKVVK